MIRREFNRSRRIFTVAIGNAFPLEIAVGKETFYNGIK
jgi:hypothetical protein